MELEAEVAKLKEENQELQKKQVCFVIMSHNFCKHELINLQCLTLFSVHWLLQADLMEMQKNQVLRSLLKP